MGFKDGAGGRALRVDNAAMLPVKAKFQRNLCGFVGMADLLQSLLKTANSNEKEVKAMREGFLHIRLSNMSGLSVHPQNQIQAAEFLRDCG